MANLRINSLEALKEYNANPTTEKPIVLEWFFDWFFRELLEKGKTDEALEAVEVMVTFGMVCEGYDRDKSENVTASNLRYYSNYSGKWSDLMDELWKQIPWYEEYTEQ